MDNQEVTSTPNTASTQSVGSASSANNAANKGPNFAAAALWASAFMLAALTIVQAGRIGGSSAYAGTANAGRDGVSSVTIPTGLGPDNKPYEALWIVDNRSEMLSVYYIENANSGEKSLQLRFVQSLPELFRQARGGS